MPYVECAICSTCSANVSCGSHEFHEIREYRETPLSESRELHASPSREVIHEEFTLSEEQRLQMNRGWPKRLPRSFSSDASTPKLSRNSSSGRNSSLRPLRTFPG